MYITSSANNFLLFIPKERMPQMDVPSAQTPGRKVLPLQSSELCESGGGRPGLPVPNSPYGLCGCKATLNLFLLNNADFHTNVNIDTIFYVFKPTCVFDISRFDTINDNARLTKNGVI